MVNGSKPTGIAAALSNSKVFRDYQIAFTKASGLRLILREPFAKDDVPPWPDPNSFCALIARNGDSCHSCLQFQRRLEKNAGTKICSLKCFAGFHETTVPLVVGGKIVAFLETGHVFLQKPSRQMFQQLARTVSEWGAKVDIKHAEEVWLATSVFTPETYEGFIHMLDAFARYLETCSNAVAIDAYGSEQVAIQKAKDFIVANSNKDLSLKKVAGVVNLSAPYFCKKFKNSTGITFTEYVARVRVEKARHFLQKDPALRVSEIAFKAGFQSVSQFNRHFRRIFGQSPSDLRKFKGAR